MSNEGFFDFNLDWMKGAVAYLRDGGIFGTFIDWRGAPTVAAAAAKAGLTPLNLIVWAKTNAGMGSLYRSAHELLPLFKKGGTPHVNNVELGKRGRWRSNGWTYPGASAFGSDARRGLQDHPTVKPVAMLEDALLDLTNRGDMVLDPFLESGSTLIAAEKVAPRRTSRESICPWPVPRSSPGDLSHDTHALLSDFRGIGSGRLGHRVTFLFLIMPFGRFSSRPVGPE